jgi:tight adherence protein B
MTVSSSRSSESIPWQAHASQLTLFDKYIPMMQLIIIAAVFFCVSAVVLVVGLTMRGERAAIADERFNIITGNTTVSTKSTLDTGLLGSFMESTNPIEQYFVKNFNLKKYLEQSGLSLTPLKFLAITACLFLAGMFLSPMVRVPVILAPVVGLVLALLPMGAVWWKRGSRITAFSRQLPEALELMSRALKSGHSMASGIHLVADELHDPIRSEFSKVYESQNLGIPLEQALEEMTERVPNLDLRFFVTAVILQRQTGGDLCEILDKIGSLVRERFKIWGHIQALTGEGRLSAIVLLSLAPALFLVTMKMNPEYAMTLFIDPLGQRMLMTAVFMQFLGALVIKKIINIQV